jgi:outer membrane protein assembly factor BamB
MNSQTSPLPPHAKTLTLLLLCAFAFLVAPLALTRAATGAPQEIETTLGWEPIPGVTRYRLQVSTDARFNDIVFDGAVSGLSQVVPLAPGKYYWHVAPAPKETGRYSPTRVIEVGVTATSPTPIATPTPRPIPTRTPRLITTPTPRAVMTPTPRAVPTRTPRVVATPTPRVVATPLPIAPAIMRPPAELGWETATGKVDRPVAARLRAGQPFDLVAVNSDGTVFALEGATGAALWTARFVPGRQATSGAGTSNGTAFTPLIVPAPQRDATNVLVGFEGGVRLLEGETGRELWRATTKGRATAGCVTELDGDTTAPEIAVTTDDATLYVLNSASGAALSQTKLDGEAIGVPIPFAHGEQRGVAMSLKGAQLDVRGAKGERVNAVKFDVPFVTPPLVIVGPLGTLVIVGTEHGLLFLNGDLRPLGRITTEGEAPRGRLAAADIDGNGSVEIVMVTTRGRIAVISGEGKINWSAQGGRDAYMPVFADLNRDGYLDLITADEGAFMRGFSGRDGTPIWQADADPKTAGSPSGEGRALRGLAVAPDAAGVPFVVGGDHGRNALRAVALPAGSVRVAPK